MRESHRQHHYLEDHFNLSEEEPDITSSDFEHKRDPQPKALDLQKFHIRVNCKSGAKDGDQIYYQL